MSSIDAFDREETALLQRGPCLRDVIVTVDRRTNHSIRVAHDGNDQSLHPSNKHSSNALDHDENCAACRVNPREKSSRHCESCHNKLMTDGGSVDGTDLAEIVAKPDRAKERWNDPRRVRPQEPKITVSADLFAELLAYAGQGDILTRRERRGFLQGRSLFLRFRNHTPRGSSVGISDRIVRCLAPNAPK